VFTTDNRNWEFEQGGILDKMRLSRAVAVDMESATVAANGFRYRVPTATLLAVSDKPLHGRPKLSDAAQDFYTATKRWHLEVAVEVVDRVRAAHPDGLPAADVRSSDEPLLGRD
jgi:AMP nucleosidase